MFPAVYKGRPSGTLAAGAGKVDAADIDQKSRLLQIRLHLARPTVSLCESMPERDLQDRIIGCARVSMYGRALDADIANAAASLSNVS